MQDYEVQVGDTVGSIAKRFGVPASSVSGYRSNDANVIFPGERLRISAPATPVAPASAPVAPAAPPIPQTSPEGVALVAPPSGPGSQPTAPVAPVQPPAAPQAPAQPQAQPEAPAPVAAPSQPAAPAAPVAPAPRTFESPAGAVIDETGKVVSAPIEQGLDSLLKDLSESNPELADEVMNALGYSTAPAKVLQNYGLNPSLVEKGFELNPMQTISSLIQQVMQATGLPDIRQNINDISKELEELDNARADEIRAVNDDPFTSAGTKKQMIEKIDDRYDQKTLARTKRLTLLQDTYNSSREEARFAATTAIGLYDKERTIQANSVEKELDRAEKRAEAARGDYQVVTLKDEFGNEYTQVFDKKTGTFRNSGGSSGPSSNPLTSGPELAGQDKEQMDGLRDVAQNLASSFTTKFQQQQYLRTVNELASRGDAQGLSEFIFSRAIDTLPDSDERKKVRGRYEMVTRLNRIGDLLTAYEQAGGKTGFFKGNIQNIKERFGQEGDANLAAIGTAIASALDELVRFRTGAALTESEERFYQKLLPGTFKSAELNEANIAGLRDSLAYDVDNALKLQLTSGGYDILNETLSGSPVSQNPTPSGGNVVLAKGKLTDRQFVDQSLTKQGIKYDDVINQVPRGKIAVIDNVTGRVGAIDPNSFDTKLYTRL